MIFLIKIKIFYAQVFKNKKKENTVCREKPSIIYVNNLIYLQPELLVLFLTTKSERRNTKCRMLLILILRIVPEII